MCSWRHTFYLEFGLIYIIYMCIYVPGNKEILLKIIISV